MFDLSSFYLPTANAEPQGDYYCYFCRYFLVSNKRVNPFIVKRAYLFIVFEKKNPPYPPTVWW
jgi:hypothetical protein